MPAGARHENEQSSGGVGRPFGRSSGGKRVDERQPDERKPRRYFKRIYLIVMAPRVGHSLWADMPIKADTYCQQKFSIPSENTNGKDYAEGSTPN